jgi:hypothetical protein
VPISVQALELLSPTSLLLPSLRLPVKSYILPPSGLVWWENNSLHTKSSRPLAYTHRSVGEKEPPERSSASSSSARVKTSDHVFGECLRHLYLHRDIFSNMLLLGVVFLFTQGSEDRHCNLSAWHRAGQLHQQALCRLAPAWMPLGITSFESSL